jgi:lipoprotein NlpI
MNNSIRVILIIVFSILFSCATTPKGQQRSSEAKAYLNRGYYFTSKRQYDEAISDYTKALEINPRYIEAYNNRGLACASKGQYDNAISDYNEALKINPRYIEAYNNRGNAYLSKGQYDNAISDYNKILKIDSRYAVAYYNRGVAYTAKGQYDQAISDFSKALEIIPWFESAYSNRARTYYLKKNYDKSWDILYCPCQEGKRKNLICLKNNPLENVTILNNTSPLNPVGILFVDRRFSRFQRTLNLIVTNIRCIPPVQDRLASLIQIPKFSERPWIVPHEVHYGLHVVARALLVENKLLFILCSNKQDRIVPSSSSRSKQSPTV